MSTLANFFAKFVGKKNSHNEKALKTKKCVSCSMQKKYKHCCYNECFNNSIFGATLFVDVSETKWMLTLPHEIELSIALIPQRLQSIIPIIKSFLPHKKRTQKPSKKQKNKYANQTPNQKTVNNIDKKKTIQELKKKNNFMLIPNVSDRLRSASVGDIADQKNHNSSPNSVYCAYFHGYISLYNNYLPCCSHWIKSLEFHSQYKSYKSVKITILGDAGVGKTSLAYRYVNNEFSESHEATIEDLYYKKLEWWYEETNSKKESKMYPYVCLSIMDTAGGATNINATEDDFIKWMDDSDVILLCFDITLPFTLKYIKTFLLPRIQNHFEKKSQNGQKYIIDKSKNKKNVHTGCVSLILVGNKCDLRSNDILGTNHASNDYIMNELQPRNNMFLDDTEILKRKTKAIKQKDEMYQAAMDLANDWNIPYIETSSKDDKNVSFLFLQSVYEHWLQSQTNSVNWHCN